MKSIEMEDISQFVELQRQLALEFSKQHPASKDLRWLLDFPKIGTVQVNSELWEFVKHGAGLRFMRLSGEPHMVVDIHKFFGEPKFIDEWRLLQFFESCGIDLTEDQLSSLLSEMCSGGYLLDQGDRQYLFSG